MDFSDLDRAALTAAIKQLEEPGFAGKMTTLAGRPAELVARALPRRAASMVAKAAEAALTRALDIALFSLRDQRFIAGRVVHSALASASGAVGGAFGLAALPVELPVSTAIMLRTIAVIAREEGEDLADPRTRLACLEVFALGHTGIAAPDGAEGGYFALRALLARGLALSRRYACTQRRRAQQFRADASGSGANCFRPVYGHCLSEAHVPGSGNYRRRRRGRGQPCLFDRAIPRPGARPFHGAPAGTRFYGAEAVRAEYDQLSRSPDLDIRGSCQLDLAETGRRLRAQSVVRLGDDQIHRDIEGLRIRSFRVAGIQIQRRWRTGAASMTRACIKIAAAIAQPIGSAIEADEGFEDHRWHHDLALFRDRDVSTLH